MPTKLAHTATLKGGFTCVSAALVIATAALFTIAGAPAIASPRSETPRPPMVRPPYVKPPIVRPPRAGIEGARESARKKKDKKEGCTLRRCEEKIADIEKDFLGSKDGKDAKKKIADAKKIRDKELKAATDEYRKKVKAKMALKDDDYACCIYTSEEIKNAENEWVSGLSGAHKKFGKAKKKAIGDGLKKSNPKKGKEYEKAQAELDKIKKAQPKETKIGDSTPVEGGGMPWDPPVKPRGPGPVGGPVQP